MKRIYQFLFTCILLSLVPGIGAADNDIYFPPAKGAWETMDSGELGWDKAKLQMALDFAGRNQSSGVVVLYRGRIIAEEYWDVEGYRSEKYQQRAIARNSAGRNIEDVASAQKSVTSVLVGIAKQKGLLELDDRVDTYLGEGWSRTDLEHEKKITIRHIITMSSGLTDRGQFEAPAGEKWRYNTTAYSMNLKVLEKASGMDRNELTKKWLTEPLGMIDSKWVPRTIAELQSVNSYGFATTARDLARFGLMMLAEGTWGGEPILSDRQYLKESTTSSQKLNPYYGYLWWLNRDAFSPEKGPRVEAAPIDMYSANGALIRRCYVVPSMDLVITRLGDQPDAGRAFDQEFWKLLMDAVGSGEN